MRFVPALRAALDAQVNLTARLSARDFASPSACAEWSVREVLNHSVGVTQKFSSFAAGATDMPRTPPGDRLGDDPAAAVRAAAVQSAAAWARVDRTRVCRLPFAEVDCDAAAGINLVDVLAHTWDVAAALNLDVPCSEDLWATALQAAEVTLAGGRDPRHFAPPAVVTNHTAQARLLALLGRTPANTAQPP